jgi:ferredoxin-NADP reductase
MWTPDDALRIYVCGPTEFVESVTTMLIGQGHSPAVIRTERFGPSG